MFYHFSAPIAAGRMPNIQTTVNFEVWTKVLFHKRKQFNERIIKNRRLECKFLWKMPKIVFRWLCAPNRSQIIINTTFAAIEIILRNRFNQNNNWKLIRLNQPKCLFEERSRTSFSVLEYSSSFPKLECLNKPKTASSRTSENEFWMQQSTWISAVSWSLNSNRNEAYSTFRKWM